MEDKVTTLRVRTSTRNTVKALADKRGISVEDIILQLVEKNATKQILVTVDAKKFDMMVHMARLLKNTGYTSSDRLSDTLLWTFDYVMKEVQSHIDTRIQSPTPPSTQQGMYGQPRGVQTV